MANQILTYAITKWTNEIEFLAQQMPARLFVASEIRSETGSGAVAVEQVGLAAMTQVTGRAQPIEITDTPADRRWVYPPKASSPTWWIPTKNWKSDRPAGQYYPAQVAACNRFKDDTWIAAFNGNAYTGNTSTTGNAPTNTIAFPAGQIIASTVGSSGGATPVGMNVPKLRAARLLLLAAEVNLDDETPNVGMSGQQMDNMLNQAQAISLDFNDRPVLVDGKIMGFMGFNFIPSRRLLTNAAPARICQYGSSPACVLRSGRT